MKTIYEHALGGDGGLAGAYVDSGFVQISVKYPVAKLVEPLLAPLDLLRQKLEAAIPGTLGDATIDAAFADAKAAIAKLIAG